jgi:hypothetical protein
MREVKTVLPTDHRPTSLWPIKPRALVPVFLPFANRLMLPLTRWAYRGSEGIAPLILYLGSRLRWVVNFVPWSLYPWKWNPAPILFWGWVGPRAGLDVASKWKISPSCRDSNLGRSSPTVVAISAPMSEREELITESWRFHGFWWKMTNTSRYWPD